MIQMQEKLGNYILCRYIGKEYVCKIKGQWHLKLKLDTKYLLQKKKCLKSMTQNKLYMIVKINT